jgi:hypothetical protein
MRCSRGLNHEPVECCCAHGAHCFKDPDEVVYHPPGGWHHTWDEIESCRNCHVLNLTKDEVVQGMSYNWQLKVY